MASLAAKESIAGTIVTYIGVGIGFLTTFFILAKFLTPEEIGLTRLLPELASVIATPTPIVRKMDLITASSTTSPSWDVSERSR